MRHLHPRVPVVGELGVEVTAQAGDGEVGVRLLADALEGDRVEAAEWIVVLTAALTVQQVQADFDALAERLAQAEVERFVAVSVMVGVTAERRSG